MEESEGEESSKVFIQALTNLDDKTTRALFQAKKLCGTCPDQACSTRIDFFSIDDKVECDKCLQTHQIGSLINRYETDSEDHQPRLIHDFGRDFVKVDGLSNFRCKLLSPFLTTFGMDKSGNAVPLQELAGHSDTIDCGKLLGNRSFKISPLHIEIHGYGKDQSGSITYLSGLLEMLREFYGGEDRLLPIHVDGDGHCLVHAISRALTGRELFWHPLRKNLFEHLKKRLSSYIEMFRDFHDEADFQSIIKEADPDAVTGTDFTAGLGNIHIFALSNILKRPIMLLDSPQKMQNAGDYTGLFLPVFSDAEECQKKTPICIAWSGAAHNHFVPLVPIEGKTVPTIPAVLIPQIWGVPSEMGQKYLNYNEDGSITVCDGKPILTRYLQKLSSAMERKFSEQHMVSPVVVEDCGRYVYKLADNPALQPRDMISLARNLVFNQRLFRCLNCGAMSQSDEDEDWFKPGGYLYNLAVECHEKLLSEKIYAFPHNGLTCTYNSTLNRLIPVMHVCNFCKEMTGRPVREDSSLAYLNGDRTETPNNLNGTKVFWEGIEYDNMPHTFSVYVTMSEDKKQIEVPIVWFHGESDSNLNSDASIEAKKAVNRYFSELPDALELVEELTNLIVEECRKLKLDGAQESSCRERTSGGDQKIVRSSKTVSRKHTNPVGENVSLLSALSVTPSETSSSSTQSAYKRKSDGQPTETATSPFASKLTNFDSKCVVKISHSNGETKTVCFDSAITMAEFQEKIEELYNVEPIRQILKHGFPPKILQAPTDGGPLGLKSGDKITLTVKSDSSQFQHPQMTDEILKQNLENCLARVYSEQEARKDELQKGFDNSDCISMWEYAMGKPELFYPGGYFYEQFKYDIGLVDGQHCHLPLLKGMVFRYNHIHDRVELCLEPYMDHYPIDDEIAHRYRKYLAIKATGPTSVSSQTESTKASNSIPGSSTPNRSESLRPSINLAPGYHTIGDKPAELSQKEIDLQRESIQQMVEKICSKQSNSL